MKKIWRILLILCLFFNISGIVSYCIELFNQDIEEKYVTIIDTYHVGSYVNNIGGYSRYAAFVDKEGKKGVLSSSKLKVGDEITVYINLNSANANGGDPKWFESRAMVMKNSIISVLMFVGLTIINFGLLLFW